MGLVVGSGNIQGIVTVLAGATTAYVNTYGQPVSVLCVNNATAGTVTITSPSGNSAAYVPVASQLHCIRLGVGCSVTFSQAPGPVTILAD